MENVLSSNHTKAMEAITSVPFAMLPHNTKALLCV